MYQSFEEVKYMKERRKKIEILHSSDASFYDNIVDSLCSSNNGGTRKRSLVVRKSSNLDSQCVFASSARMDYGVQFQFSPWLY